MIESAQGKSDSLSDLSPCCHILAAAVVADGGERSADGALYVASLQSSFYRYHHTVMLKESIVTEALGFFVSMLVHIDPVMSHRMAFAYYMSYRMTEMEVIFSNPDALLPLHHDALGTPVCCHFHEFGDAYVK